MTHLFALVLTGALLAGADATGVWSGTLTVSNGAESREIPAHLVLKQEGETVTGTAGPDASQQEPIQNGKVENGRLMFELPINEAVMKFALVQEGEELKGDVTREREGQTQRGVLSAKRAK